jgi:tetratricopeptide (TPR) repeat protein
MSTQSISPSRVNRLIVLAILGLPIISQARAEDVDQLFRDYTAQYEAGKYAEAQRTAERLVAASITPTRLAASLNLQGRALNALHKYEEAIPVLERANAIALAEDQINRGWIPNNLATAYRHTKRHADAEQLLLQARKEFERLKGRESREVGSVLENLGWVTYEQKHYEQSEAYHREALSVRTAVIGPKNSAVASSMNGLGVLLTAMGRNDEARQTLEAALKMTQETASPTHPDVAVVLSNLGNLAMKRGDAPAAESFYRQSLALREKLFDKNSKIVAETMLELARSFDAQGKAQEAKALRDRVQAAKESQQKASSEKSKPARP